MELQRITGRAQKCGPSVLSTLTGIPTHETARTIRDVRRDGRPVNGVTDRHLILAALRLGIRLVRTMGTPGVYTGRKGTPTITRWARTAADGTYVLIASVHYLAVVIRDGRIVSAADSCNRKPVPWREFPDATGRPAVLGRCGVHRRAEGGMMAKATGWLVDLAGREVLRPRWMILDWIKLHDAQSAGTIAEFRIGLR